MSLRPSSWDPDHQHVFDCIRRKNNEGLRAALGKWVDDGKSLDGDAFFAAASSKQGGGVARILVEFGFTCSGKILEQACSRACWPVVAAILPVSADMPASFVFEARALEDSHPLRSIMKSAPLDLASKILHRYKDTAAAAQMALDALPFEEEGMFDVARLVPFLLDHGASMDKLLPSTLGAMIRLKPSTLPRRGQFSVLSRAVNRGRACLAVALVKAGADLTCLDNAQEAIVDCVLSSRDKQENPQPGDASRCISPAGWQLLEIAAGCGLVSIDIATDPWPHLRQYDRTLTRLSFLDAARLDAFLQSHHLQANTSKVAASKRPSARL